MKSLSPIIFAFGLVAVASCDNDSKVEPKVTDHLVFGHFYGLCWGEQCVEIFKLQDGVLYEDQNDFYPGSEAPYVADYVALSGEIYEKVKDLIDDFPSELFDEAKNVLGTPDAGDWGGLYVEYNFDGVEGFWLLDQMQSNMPDYTHAFVDSINAKIALINN